MFLNLQAIDDFRSATRARVSAAARSLFDAARAADSALPSHLALTQRGAAALRAFLDSSGLTAHRIFLPRVLELADLDELLPKLDPAARWKPAPALVRFGVPVDVVTHPDPNSLVRSRESGFIYLKAFDVALARWWWVNADAETPSRSLWLVAARNADAVARLRDAMSANRRGGTQSVWKIVCGPSYRDRSVPRPTVPRDDLVLHAALADRINADVLRFFTPEVAALYTKLRVPHRRGVLMHGPPGNGKTSIIRWIGGELSNIPAMILRAQGRFDADAFAEVFRRWKLAAPAILVIEDLNWIIERIDLSSFLNTLDGIDNDIAGGLLLLATTNYPEKLDPAINNRPGRFDVTIEIPSPDEPPRREFLRRKLSSISESTVDIVADLLEHCSFAPLQELLRLSGLYAIHAGRTERIDEDVMCAARDVAAAHETAAGGFGPKVDVPFGLQHLKALRNAD